MSDTKIEKAKPAQALERVLLQGDLSPLGAEERIAYYKTVCESVGLNPFTKPFEYINLNGKLTLYALKTCTDQLRTIHTVSIEKLERELVGDVYTVTAYAKLPDGRQDSSIGAVCVGNLRGDALANAYMKAETKAKRRVTLSICGLGMLDEVEVETITNGRHEVQQLPEQPKQVVLLTHEQQDELDRELIANYTGLGGAESAEIGSHLLRALGCKSGSDIPARFFELLILLIQTHCDFTRFKDGELGAFTNPQIGTATDKRRRMLAALQAQTEAQQEHAGATV